MTSTTLDLGRVVLINSAEKLKLAAVCAGSFHVPYLVSTLDHADIQQEFDSGHVYTTRGIGCCLGIKILSDDQLLENATRDALIHKLAGHLLKNQVSPGFVGTIHN